MTVQNHFHLDVVGIVDGDSAPTKTYGAHERSPQPTVQTMVTTSVTGARHRSTVLDDSGDPVLHQDFKYRVRLTPAEYATLLTLLGRTLSFVDNDHPDVGSDASAYVKSVAFVSISDVVKIAHDFNPMEAVIELTDLS